MTSYNFHSKKGLLQIPEMAAIKPIFKKGSPHLLSSCRPVSLASISTKVFEDIPKKAWSQQQRSNYTLDSSQNGFFLDRPRIYNVLIVAENMTNA